MEDINNLILKHLRVIRADIAIVKDDVREIKTRVTSLESAVGGATRGPSETYASLSKIPTSKPD